MNMNDIQVGSRFKRCGVHDTGLDNQGGGGGTCGTGQRSRLRTLFFLALGVTSCLWVLYGSGFGVFCRYGLLLVRKRLNT